MRWFLLIALAVLLWLALQSSQGDGGGDSAIPVGEPADAGTDPANYGGGAYGVAEAWARIEGFFQPGTVAQRYNNPVNLHGDWPGVTGHTPSGIAIFGSIQDGWNAAIAYVQQQAAQHPGWSFSNFFGKVLGNLQGQPVNNEQGDSEAEASYVTGRLGVSNSSLLSDYVG